MLLLREIASDLSLVQSLDTKFHNFKLGSTIQRKKKLKHFWINSFATIINTIDE